MKKNKTNPQVTISSHERWLFKNKAAAKIVKTGLDDVKKKRLVKASEDFSKYTD